MRIIINIRKGNPFINKNPSKNIPVAVEIAASMLRHGTNGGVIKDENGNIVGFLTVIQERL